MIRLGYRPPTRYDANGTPPTKYSRFAQIFRPGKRRVIVLGTVFFLLLLVIGAFNHRAQEYPTTGASNSDELSDYGRGGDIRYPPTWHKLAQWEDKLPQHNLSLPYPEGSTGRYVYFSNQAQRTGWNNVLTEMLMNAHLAYESKRAYVFVDYFWNHQHHAWHKDRTKWPNPFSLRWDPRTPLNAILSGPIAGGPWDEGDDAPRSINYRYWQKVCPPHEIRYINTQEVKPRINGDTGIRIFEEWKKVLLEAPERCVEIQAADPREDYYSQVFDFWLWGSSRVLSLWDSFSKSPTARLLSASHLVLSAVERNGYLFHPHGPKYAGKISRDPYDHMMAMHIRRGDYKKHCAHLANWNATFYGWNQLPTIPDLWFGPDPPPGGQEMGTNTPENVAEFLTHCLPSKAQIVKKARTSREDYVREGRAKGEDRVLDVMYLLTNDHTQWARDLKLLLKADGWNVVRTSNDLELDQLQMDVNMAIDMEIARRAAVFVGNGWSSYTSNILQRRLVDGRDATTNRFW